MVSLIKTSFPLFLGLLLVGCGSPLSSQTTPPPQGQMLPISATVTLRNQVIELEVAETPEQQEMGLMYRTSLPDNRGMLFPFSPPRRVRFWMKNTLIPLDMIFLHEGTVKAIIPNVPPCSVDPCPLYGPDAIVDQVIELRAGRAAEIGVQPGDRTIFQWQKTP